MLIVVNTNEDTMLVAQYRLCERICVIQLWYLTRGTFSFTLIFRYVRACGSIIQLSLVPTFNYVTHKPVLSLWAENQGKYQSSIDWLPSSPNKITASDWSAAGFSVKPARGYRHLNCWLGSKQSLILLETILASEASSMPCEQREQHASDVT